MPSTTPTPATPNEFIQQWGRDVLAVDMDEGGIPVTPSPDALDQVVLALHAVQEFLIEPIGAQLQRLADATSSEWADRRGLIPEEERLFDYEDVGRLIVWTDTLRAELGYTLDAVRDIALLAHDDIPHLVEGYVSDGQATKPGRWNEHLRRLHGLDVVA
jgi:hypothetical protein